MGGLALEVAAEFGLPANRKDVDRHVGARLRKLRIAAGLSQSALADLIGVTYQQAHKYESGMNRISASRLFAGSRSPSTSEVNDFFEGLEAPACLAEPADQRHIVDLARLYRQIMVPSHKRLLRAMAAALAGNGTAEAALTGGD